MRALDPRAALATRSSDIDRVPGSRALQIVSSRCKDARRNSRNKNWVSAIKLEAPPATTCNGLHRCASDCNVRRPTPGSRKSNLSRHGTRRLPATQSRQSGRSTVRGAVRPARGIVASSPDSRVQGDQRECSSRHARYTRARDPDLGCRRARRLLVWLRHCGDQRRECASRNLGCLPRRDPSKLVRSAAISNGMPIPKSVGYVGQLASWSTPGAGRRAPSA
jgi:hypothetical protein